jgi:L-fuconolactonase
MQKLIDSHIHFWNPNLLKYDWLADFPVLNKVHLPIDLPSHGSGWEMEKLVFVQADSASEQGLAEAKWVSELHDARIAGIVAFAPLEKGNAARKQLEVLQDIPQVKGVRRLIQSEELGFSTQRDFIRAVRLLPAFGFSFDICVVHPQLPDVIELVRQCPDVSFVLDHFGKPDIANHLLDPWRANISTLAEFENVHCKLSGLVTEANHEKWTVKDLLPYFEHVLESFGAERLMFGGDFPVVKLAATYPKWVETALELTSILSNDEKHQIYYANAQSFYRLDK